MDYIWTARFVFEWYYIQFVSTALKLNKQLCEYFLLLSKFVIDYFGKIELVMLAIN